MSVWHPDFLELRCSMYSSLQEQIIDAQIGNDVLRRIGKIINHARTRYSRGCLLGMLAIEVSLRKGNLRVARHILVLSRNLLIDEYHALVISGSQSYVIAEVCAMTEAEREEIIRERKRQWHLKKRLSSGL